MVSHNPIGSGGHQSFEYSGEQHQLRARFIELQRDELVVLLEEH